MVRSSQLKHLRSRNKSASQEETARPLINCLGTAGSGLWTLPIRDWKAALNRFAIQFDDWMPHR
ncbi:MAG TPA: hypothetical protein DCQ77_09250 [Betaproteobacteria bacterium]|nr:hypothetical protein [Betaproteobacteria bacterium]